MSNMILKHSPTVGDYVFASHWSDGDPNDPWQVGYIEVVLMDSKGIYYQVTGSKRYWKHAKKICQTKGEWILKNYPQKSRYN